VKKKIFYSAIFILFLIIFIFGFKEMKLFFYNELGNRAQIKKMYEDARINYEEALKVQESNKVRNNLLTNEYEAKNYKKVVDIPTFEKYFIQGNSYVKLGEEAQEQKEIIENFQKALEHYKKAMNISEDINIKKNYEIIQKRLDDIKQQEQQKQNQENQEKQEDKNQESSSKNSQEQQKDQKEKEKQKQEQEQNQDQQSNQQQQEEQNQENQEDETKREQIEKEEVMSILKKLEGNEKQSFKNNERILHNQNQHNSKNRW
jgi:Ca-activated chloride channel family protein